MVLIVVIMVLMMVRFGLLALVGGRRRGGKTHALAPVHTSALLGLYQGARAGRGADSSEVEQHRGLGVSAPP